MPTPIPPPNGKYLKVPLPTQPTVPKPVQPKTKMLDGRLRWREVKGIPKPDRKGYY